MKKSLLIRFRWPIFIAVFSSAHVAGIAYLYGDTETAMYGLVAFFVAAGVAVVRVEGRARSDRVMPVRAVEFP